MPRSNRSRRSGSAPRYEHQDFGFMLAGSRRTETRRGVDYTVQPVAERSATKTYTCPGCARVIAVGVAHVVTWRADSVMGEQAGLEARRHWHNHCWQIS